MAVRLQFEGIRCFHKPQDAAIRPITLLVGENSSGKSTFLALCRIAHAMVWGQLKRLPFNEAPFLLGAYDQIASNRGGKLGLARSFSVAVMIDDGSEQTSLRTEFVSRDGQPSPKNWQLKAGLSEIQATRQSGSDDYSMILQSPWGKAESALGQYFEFESLADLPVENWAGLVVSQIEQEGFPGEMPPFDSSSLSAAEGLLREEFLRRPYAFAPIRTSPRRTYDPISAESEPEGSHVPMLMAALSRSPEKRAWKALQLALSEFGSGSGLFDGIEIVNKGKKESDPFQIGIKSGGSVSNLIDVGYGVSQALPILVDTIQRSLASEFFLLQQPEVHLHPRAQAELGSFFAKQVGKQRRFVIETHSDYLVDRIRMEVRRKQLKPEDVSLLYFERNKREATIHNLELDRNGSIMDPPPGYRQFFLNEGRDLLGI